MYFKLSLKTFRPQEVSKTSAKDLPRIRPVIKEDHPFIQEFQYCRPETFIPMSLSFQPIFRPLSAFLCKYYFHKFVSRRKISKTNLINCHQMS